MISVLKQICVFVVLQEPYLVDIFILSLIVTLVWRKEVQNLHIGLVFELRLLIKGFKIYIIVLPLSCYNKIKIIIMWIYFYYDWLINKPKMAHHMLVVLVVCEVVLHFDKICVISFLLD